MKAKVIRFFTAGGHDAGTGLYAHVPGEDITVTDKHRLAILIKRDGEASSDRPMVATNKLRSPFNNSLDINPTL